jgi:hypothetical protein
MGADEREIGTVTRIEAAPLPPPIQTEDNAWWRRRRPQGMTYGLWGLAFAIPDSSGTHLHHVAGPQLTNNRTVMITEERDAKIVAMLTFEKRDSWQADIVRDGQSLGKHDGTHIVDANGTVLAHITKRSEREIVIEAAGPLYDPFWSVAVLAALCRHLPRPS